ncbi:MAG TPA: hypothetical protein VM925_22600 [Labilithrix sp.]|nr:hypothetical protein [Labilithrix sp.]
MLRSHLSFVAAFALAACTATTTSNGLGTDPTNPNPDPTNPDPTNPDPTKNPDPTPGTTPDPNPTPEKVTFEYSSVPLPATDLEIGSIGGSSGSDVWIVGAESTATSKDPWNAYHYDGTKWATTKLTSTQGTGRPSFGVVSTGSSAFMGFSYSGDVFELSGSSLTLVASLSVTSGYSMAAIGSTVFVGTQENFGAGPLYKITNGKAKQLPVDQGIGGVLGIWGATEDDVWLARSEGLGHFVGGKYEDTDPNPYVDVHGSAKDNVWAVGANGVRRFDGTQWSEVTFPLGSSRYDGPSSVSVLSSDEVVVTTGDGKIYRYDGTTFVLDSRANAPKSAGTVGHIGKDETWLVGTTSIGRLAPKKK